MKDMEIQSEDIGLFITELSELIESAEASLLGLEKNPADNELIREIFRVIHTVKGGVATLGLDMAVKITHEMESILDGVRSGERHLTGSLMDALFAVLDYLKDLKETLSAGSQIDEKEGQEVLRLVCAETKKDSCTAGSNDATPKASTEKRPVDGLPAPVQEALKARQPVDEVTLKFVSDAPLLSVRFYQALLLLEQVGDVLASVPDREAIENDVVGDMLRVYIQRPADSQDVLKKASTVPDVASVDLKELDPQRFDDTRSGVSQGESNGKEKDPRGRRDLGQTTVRVDVGLLDLLMNLVGELVIDRTRLSQIAVQLQEIPETASYGAEVGSLVSHLQRTCADLQEGIMRARLLPLRSIFSKFPRMMRDLAKRCGKEVDFLVEGEDCELDRTVLEAIDDPLVHILRNAIDHGLEEPSVRERAGKSRTGTVKLSAWHEENQVLVTVEDDGRGIDAEKVKEAAVKKGLISREASEKMDEAQTLDLLFLPGFSTNSKATEVSGRGYGLDIVKRNLERINGHLEVHTVRGHGTRFTLHLPLTLAIMRALLIRAEDSIYAVPTSSVEEVLDLREMRIQSVKRRKVMNVRGRIVPYVSLAGALTSSVDINQSHRYALLARATERPLAVGVDELLGEEEIVVKQMGRLFQGVQGIAGATILARGDPAVILDIYRIVAGEGEFEGDSSIPMRW